MDNRVGHVRRGGGGARQTEERRDDMDAEYRETEGQRRGTRALRESWGNCDSDPAVTARRDFAAAGQNERDGYDSIKGNCDSDPGGMAPYKQRASLRGRGAGLVSQTEGGHAPNKR